MLEFSEQSHDGTDRRLGSPPQGGLNLQRLRNFSLLGYPVLWQFGVLSLAWSRRFDTLIFLDCMWYLSTWPAGFQWKCGQESAVRLMAILFGAWALAGHASFTGERWQQLARLA